jgi:hypothetical protein
VRTWAWSTACAHLLIDHGRDLRGHVNGRPACVLDEQRDRIIVDAGIGDLPAD